MLLFHVLPIRSSQKPARTRTPETGLEAKRGNFIAIAVHFSPQKGAKAARKSGAGCSSPPGAFPRRKFRRAEAIAGEVALVQAGQFGLGHLGEAPAVLGLRQ